MTKRHWTENARWLTVRAWLAGIWWLFMSGLFVMIGLALIGQGLFGDWDDAMQRVLGGVGAIVIGVFIGLIFGTVWWYRRQLWRLHQAGDSESLRRGQQISRIKALMFRDNVYGIDMGGYRAPAVARFINGHGGTILIVMGLAVLVLALFVGPNE